MRWAFLLPLVLASCAVLPWNWGAGHGGLAPTSGQEQPSDAPNAPDDGSGVFTDPHTGEVWVRPGWLWSAAGLAAMAAAWRGKRRLDAWAAGGE